MKLKVLHIITVLATKKSPEKSRSESKVEVKVKVLHVITALPTKNTPIFSSSSKLRHNSPGLMSYTTHRQNSHDSGNFNKSEKISNLTVGTSSCN